LFRDVAQPNRLALIFVYRQRAIRIEQSNGRKDRNVMLSPEICGNGGGASVGEQSENWRAG
jgi:hypothetical protein